MNTELLHILSNGFWCAMAGLGFGALFNAPKRALFAIAGCGLLAGIIKYSIMSAWLGGGIVLATLAGSLCIGFVSILLSHLVHVSPNIIAVTSTIAFVPGYYAYKTMLNLIKFIKHQDTVVMTEMMHQAAMTMFIVIAIALGATLPMLVLRIDTVKHLKLHSNKDKEE